MHLVQAYSQYRQARRKNAAMFAGPAFQEATILLHCSQEEYGKSKFPVANALALVAIQKANEALNITEKAKAQSREKINRDIEGVSLDLREIGRTLAQHSQQTDVKKALEECQTKIDNTLSDLSTARRCLEADDLNAAESHLKFAQAMIKHLKRQFHNTLSKTDGSQ